MHENKVSEKSNIVCFLLWFFLGFWGLHRFYVGKTGTGIIWLLTLGCFGIGVIVDFFLIVTESFKDKEDKLLKW